MVAIKCGIVNVTGAHRLKATITDTRGALKTNAAPSCRRLLLKKIESNANIGFCVSYLVCSFYPYNAVDVAV